MPQAVEELSEVAGLLTGQPAEPAPEGANADDPPPAAEVLLSALDDAPEPASQPDPDPVEEPAKMSVKDLAKRLDTSAAKIYSDLVLNIGGEDMTVGELKDRAKDLHKADTLLAEAQNNALTGGNDLLRRNREFSVAQQALGREPTQAEIQEAETRHQTYKREQRTLELQSIPSWSDPAVEAVDRKRVVKLLTEYGFDPVEIENIFDARQVKVLVDYSAIRERLANVKTSEVITPVNQGGRRARKSAPKKRDVKSMVAKGELTQAQGVIALLADGVHLK